MLIVYDTLLFTVVTNCIFLNRYMLFITSDFVKYTFSPQFCLEKLSFKSYRLLLYTCSNVFEYCHLWGNNKNCEVIKELRVLYCYTFTVLTSIKSCLTNTFSFMISISHCSISLIIFILTSFNDFSYCSKV